MTSMTQSDETNATLSTSEVQRFDEGGRCSFRMLLQKLGAEHQRLEKSKSDVVATNRALLSVCSRMRDMCSRLIDESSPPEGMLDLEREIEKLELQSNSLDVEWTSKKSSESRVSNASCDFVLRQAAPADKRHVKHLKTWSSSSDTLDRGSKNAWGAKAAMQVVPMALIPSDRPNQLLVPRPNNNAPSGSPTMQSGLSEDTSVKLQDSEIRAIEQMRRNEYEKERKISAYEHDFVDSQRKSFRASLDTFNVGESESTSSAIHSFVCRIVTSVSFDAFIGSVILLNMIILGIECNHNATSSEPLPTWTRVLDNLTRIIFVTELSLRFYAYGVRKSFRSTWVRFDMLMVFVGVTDWILHMAMLDDNILANLMAIRIMRLARLARSLRLMVQFRTVWLLCVALYHSIHTLFWTLTLICLLTYVFAILGVELLPPRDNQLDTIYGRVAADNFGSLSTAMVSLFQVMTFDDAAEVYRPLMLDGNPWVTVPYFSAFILFAGIALMNLVTAMMVDVSLQQSNRDMEAQKAWEESRKKTLIPKLQNMFAAIDADNSGEIELSEIMDAPTELKETLASLVHVESIEKLFNMLDYDQSGAIGIDEFLDGVLRAQGEKPIELHCLMKQCGEILKTIRDIEINIDQTSSTSEQPRRGSSDQVLS